MADYRIVVLEVACRGLWAEALLNGAPIVRVTDGRQKMVQHKGNPWIIEGTNWLQARLGYPQGEEAVRPGAEFRLRAFEIEHGNPDAAEQMLATFEWNPEEQPVETPGLTTVLEQPIEPQQSHGRWAWEDASPYQQGDRPAVAALVAQVHGALAARDVAGVDALFAIKHEELARGLDVPAAELATDSREGLEAVFRSKDWTLAPLQPDRLVLEPTANGRLVDVFDEDGGPPVRARVFDQPFDVTMTVSHLASGWAIVR